MSTRFRLLLLGLPVLLCECGCAFKMRLGNPVKVWGMLLRSFNFMGSDHAAALLKSFSAYTFSRLHKTFCVNFETTSHQCPDFLRVFSTVVTTNHMLGEGPVIDLLCTTPEKHRRICAPSMSLAACVAAPSSGTCYIHSGPHQCAVQPSLITVAAFSD